MLVANLCYFELYWYTISYKLFCGGLQSMAGDVESDRLRKEKQTEED